MENKDLYIPEPAFNPDGKKIPTPDNTMTPDPFPDIDHPYRQPTIIPPLKKD